MHNPTPFRFVKHRTPSAEISNLRFVETQHLQSSRFLLPLLEKLQHTRNLESESEPKHLDTFDSTILTSSAHLPPQQPEQPSSPSHSPFDLLTITHPFPPNIPLQKFELEQRDTDDNSNESDSDSDPLLDDTPDSTGDNETCPICLEPFLSPFQVSCSHVFCKLCITRVAKTFVPDQPPCCPICRCGLSESEVHTLTFQTFWRKPTSTTAADQSNAIREPPREGYLFCVSDQSLAESLTKKIVGAPSSFLRLVRKIQPNSKIFLYKREQRMLLGIFRATSQGDYELNADAFPGLDLPAQVFMAIERECPPIPYANVPYSFNLRPSTFRLDPYQVLQLTQLFEEALRSQPGFTSIQRSLNLRAVW
eukprot:c4417_g1_i1.p1 GENE.c4417_g1_i1~~c4417_g1_i1.p1  ORF type:complete len:376 (-),score=87.20 c4417_g1_i1:96-1187(-)